MSVLNLSHIEPGVVRDGGGFLKKVTPNATLLCTACGSDLVTILSKSRQSSVGMEIQIEPCQACIRRAVERAKPISHLDAKRK